MDAHLSVIFPSSTGNTLFGDNLSKKPNKQTNKYENCLCDVHFTFTFFNEKYSFWADLVPKTKLSV